MTEIQVRRLPVVNRDIGAAPGALKFLVPAGGSAIASEATLRSAAVVATKMLSRDLTAGLKPSLNLTFPRSRIRSPGRLRGENSAVIDPHADSRGWAHGASY